MTEIRLPSVDLDAIRAKWLELCPYCDTDSDCNRGHDRPRGDISALVDEVERLRSLVRDAEPVHDLPVVWSDQPMHVLSPQCPCGPTIDPGRIVHGALTVAKWAATQTARLGGWINASAHWVDGIDVPVQTADRLQAALIHDGIPARTRWLDAIVVDPDPVQVDSTPCPDCGGLGLITNPDGSTWGTCETCHGTGGVE